MQGTQDAELLETVVLDNFRLRAILSQGPYGTTFLAQQRGADRMAVVEIARPALLSETGPQRVCRRFTDQMEHNWRAQHPNVAANYGSGLGPHGRPVVVTELIPGHPLEDELAASPLGLTAEVLTTVFTQLGEALVALHAAGVTQGDLSPRNVLFDPCRRGLPHVTLRTFEMGRLRGLARSIRESAQRSYLAPELLEGRSVPASDIHSLGAMLWWAITGNELPPSSIDNAYAPDAAAKRADELRAQAPRLPEPVLELLLRMLAPGEHQRPSAEQFVSEWPQVAKTLGEGLARRVRDRADQVETEPEPRRASLAELPPLPHSAAFDQAITDDYSTTLLAIAS